MMRGIAILAWTVGIMISHASAKTLTGPAIEHLVSGAVMYINTPLNTKIPVHYSEDGALSGAAGSMGFYLGAAKDTGKWWVARGRLCHKWRRWFDGDTQCLKLRKHANIIFWASDTGRTGTAHVRRSKLSSPGQVAARSNTKSKPKSHRPAAKTQAKSANLKKRPAGVVGTTEQKPEFALARNFPVKETSIATKPKVTPSRVAVGSNPEPAKIAQKAKQKPIVGPVAAPKKTSKPKTAPIAARTRSNLGGKKQALGARQTAWQKIPSFRVAFVSDLDVLNVRQGPSEYHEIVGRIPSQGRGVKIVGACRQWWCPVVHDQISGWVNRFYLVAER